MLKIEKKSAQSLVTIINFVIAINAEGKTKEINSKKKGY